MPNERGLFLILDEGRPNDEIIHATNYTCLPIKGIDDVCFQGGCFKDVYYVPNLNINILSMYQLSSSRKKVEFMHDKVFIKDAKDDYKVIAKGVVEKDSRLFQFEGFTKGMGCHGHFC